ncbi:UDP-N-acetylglucosamine 1-carboxyvinyltransferase [Patescibacteria group bacterium]|nr:UDP-N-acetylglucosamine 1-carboxyvinyltransferase [Patescibacteria group bacterium]MBU1705842.1 UDP-N-acetylglucosamine 1-carboxyvinyltransferase [Patescibacteria group bacterium]
MDAFRITGGVPLHGTVVLSGAKNAASKMIIASLLTDEPVILKNVPRQRETEITCEIAENVGAKIEWLDAHTLKIHTPTIAQTQVKKQSRKNRISILTLPPLLHRAGQAFMPSVGGDQIGPRPVNWHLMVLKKMGARVKENADGYQASVDGRLKGALIELPYPSVGATESAILSSVLADGRTVIRNAASEPEIMELIMLLQKMGAIIQINSGRSYEIIGVSKLRGCEATVMPDRIEAASFACMALGTKGDIFIKNAEHRHLMTFLNMVRRIGGEYEVKEDGIRVWAPNGFQGIELETDAHPGFATDWQQPFVVLLTQAVGTSVVHETVYEGRFGYAKELMQMGAEIALFSNCLGEVDCRFKGHNYKHSAVINGPTPLKAIDMVVPDIRAGLALVVAALTAKGTSTLTGIEHLARGYENLEAKLKYVGAQIEKIQVPDPPKK